MLIAPGDGVPSALLLGARQILYPAAMQVAAQPLLAILRKEKVVSFGKRPKLSSACLSLDGWLVATQVAMLPRTAALGDMFRGDSVRISENLAFDQAIVRTQASTHAAPLSS